MPAALAAAGVAAAADQPSHGGASWVALALVLAALGLTTRARPRNG